MMIVNAEDVEIEWSVWRFRYGCKQDSVDAGGAAVCHCGSHGATDEPFRSVGDDCES